MNSSKKLERPLRLDMDFGEALTRYVRTDPNEVATPPGRKKSKGGKPKPAAQVGKKPINAEDEA